VTLLKAWSNLGAAPGGTVRRSHRLLHCHRELSRVPFERQSRTDVTQFIQQQSSVSRRWKTIIMATRACVFFCRSSK
jgi:hypothetical protein